MEDSRNAWPLKPFDCCANIAINVPESWECRLDESGMWGCWNDDVDDGTLWVEWHPYRLPPDASYADVLAAAAVMAGSTAGSYIQRDRALELEVTFEEDRHIVETMFLGTEDGDLLQYYRWDLIKPLPGWVVVVFISLVFEIETSNTPASRALVDIMGDEVYNCVITPPDEPAAA